MASPSDSGPDLVTAAKAELDQVKEAQKKQRVEAKKVANQKAYQKRKEAAAAALSPAGGAAGTPSKSSAPATSQSENTLENSLPLATGGDWLAKSWDIDAIGNRAKLAEDRIHGHRLRLLFDVRDRIEEKPYLLAGYLHLKDTRALKSLVFSETSLNICRDWMQVVQVSLSCSVVSHFSY